jgi:hypothetical protein
MICLLKNIQFILQFCGMSYFLELKSLGDLENFELRIYNV